MPEAVLPDGGKLAYDLHDFTEPWRDAEPLIFVHGFSKIRKFWYEWLPEFARDYRVYNVDMRGHGESSPLAFDFQMSLAPFARDIVDFMDALQIERAHVIMAEFASAIAIELAADYPDRVRSAVIPGFGYNWRGGAVSPKAWADLLREKGTAAWAQETNTHRLPEDADPGLRAWYIAQQSRMPVDLMIKLFEYSIDLDQTDRLQHFKAPALIISGTNAQQATADSTRRAVELMPNCKAVLMEGMPFNVMTACPQACIAAAKDFLATLRAE
jgi:pimeloyl-ACP methyl ester carboxylesterase